MKYPITQNSAMKRYPPIRWAAIKRELAFAFFTRAEACRISQTLIAPMRTNARPSQTLVELLSMVWTVYLTLAARGQLVFQPLAFPAAASLLCWSTDKTLLGSPRSLQPRPRARMTARSPGRVDNTSSEKFAAGTLR